MADALSVPKLLQRVIDTVWGGFRFILDGITFLSIRLYGIDDCHFKNVREGYYPNIQSVPRNLDRAKDLEAILAEAKECLASAKDRRAAVTDKCKSLLTLSSLLLTIIGAVFPKWFDINAFWMQF